MRRLRNLQSRSVVALESEPRESASRAELAATEAEAPGRPVGETYTRSRLGSGGAGGPAPVLLLRGSGHTSHLFPLHKQLTVAPGLLYLFPGDFAYNCTHIKSTSWMGE